MKIDMDKPLTDSVLLEIGDDWLSRYMFNITQTEMVMDIGRMIVYMNVLQTKLRQEVMLYGTPESAKMLPSIEQLL